MRARASQAAADKDMSPREHAPGPASAFAAPRDEVQQPARGSPRPEAMSAFRPTSVAADEAGKMRLSHQTTACAASAPAAGIAAQLPVLPPLFIPSASVPVPQQEAVHPVYDLPIASLHPVRRRQQGLPYLLICTLQVQVLLHVSILPLFLP